MGGDGRGMGGEEVGVMCEYGRWGWKVFEKVWS